MYAIGNVIYGVPLTREITNAIEEAGLDYEEIIPGREA